MKRVFVLSMIIFSIGVNASPCPKEEWAKLSRESSKRMTERETKYKADFEVMASKIADDKGMSESEKSKFKVSILTSEKVRKANKKKMDYLRGHLQFIMTSPTCESIIKEDKKLEMLLIKEWEAAFSMLKK